MKTKLKLYKSLERMYIYRDRETKRDFLCVCIYISKDLYNFSFFSSLLLVLLSSLPSFSSWSSSFLYPFFLSLFSRFSFSSFFLFLFILTSFSSPFFSYSFISFSTFCFIFLSSFFSFFLGWRPIRLSMQFKFLKSLYPNYPKLNVQPNWALAQKNFKNFVK